MIMSTQRYHKSAQINDIYTLVGGDQQGDPKREWMSLKKQRRHKK